MRGIYYIVLVLLSCGSAKAVIPVTVDFSANWITEALNWAEQIKQATQAAQQAQEMVSKTKELIKLAGDPEQAVKNLNDLSKIVKKVGDLTDKAKTADKIASKLDTTAALVKSGNKLRKDISDEIEVFGATLKRDLSDVESALRYEAVVAGARSSVETNRKTQKSLSTKLKSAEELLKSATTQAQIAAAQAEVQRITALMTAADAATRNIVEDAKLTKEELEIGGDLEAAAQAQEIREKSLAVAGEMERQRTDFHASVGKALADSQAEPVNTQILFERAASPSLN